MVRRREQGNLQKGGFIWADGSEVGESITIPGKCTDAASHGGWSSDQRGHVLNRKQGAEILKPQQPGMAYFFQQSHAS